MSHSRKEGEPERKIDSPIPLDEVEGEINEPGAPSVSSGSDVDTDDEAEQETKDELDHQPIPAVQVNDEVRPPDAAYQDVLLPDEKHAELNAREEGAAEYYKQPVPEQGDGLIGLPFAVAIKLNSVAEDKAGQSNPLKCILFGNSKSKEGYLVALIGQQNLGYSMEIYGIDVKTLNLPSGHYMIQDLAAQERFQSLNSAYFRNANFVLLFSPDHNSLQRMRDFGYEIHRIDYNVDARTAAVIRNDNPIENVRAQVRVLAPDARTITENFLPQIASQLRIPAAAPPQAKPPAQGFFSKLGSFFKGDDKDDKKDQMKPPGP